MGFLCGHSKNSPAALQPPHCSFVCFIDSLSIDRWIPKRSPLYFGPGSRQGPAELRGGPEFVPADIAPDWREFAKPPVVVVVVIVGSAGCGKSTLLDCVLGHAHFDAGDGINGVRRTLKMTALEGSKYLFGDTPCLVDLIHMPRKQCST